MVPENELNWVKDRVKENVILLGYGGSYSYGTNIETSDIDLRGVFVNNLDEVIGCNPLREDYHSSEYDITIYSYKKLIKLLISCNPNVIEMLELRDQDYFIKDESGKLLIDNRHVFLSKRCIQSFGGYAKSQLNRLVNRSGKAKSLILENETRSITKALDTFSKRYSYEGNGVTVIQEADDIIANFDLKKVSITSFSNMINELNSIHRSYSKSERNDKATVHDKLAKHMMHLVRLYMMGIDILSKEEIITYRGDDHNLLMSIRNEKFLEDDRLTPTKEFNELLEEYSNKFEEAIKTTKLPDEPDYQKINYIMRKIFEINHLSKFVN